MNLLDRKRGQWAALLVLVVGLLIHASAFGQGSSVLTGTVRDAATKAPVADVVVTATSPALQGEQTVITDAAGSYRLPQLPPGDYSIRLEKEAFKPYARGGITMRVGSTIRVNVEILPEALKAEEIVVVGRAPTVDVGSTQTGLTVGSEFASRIALSPPSVKGSGTRSFESMAEVAPTVHTDTYGMSVSGTTSPENQYIIDGLSVNDPAYGLLGTPLSVEFIKEVNIITGGYMPEYGRATGGVLDAVTKSGSNELHGSVFTSITPGALEGTRAQIKREGQTILTDTSLSSNRDFGVELGGPILKDRLWFYVGFSPSFTRFRQERYLNTLKLEDGARVVDEDGFTQVSKIPGSSRAYYADGRSFQYIGKLTFLVHKDHNVTLSLYGAPTTSGGDGTYGIDPQTGTPERTNLAGTFGALATRYHSLSNDVALKWASSFLNKSLLLDVTLGWHHADNGQTPSDGSTMGSREGLADFAQVIYRKNNPYYSVGDFEGVPVNPATGQSYCATQPGPLDPTTNKPTEVNVCPVTTYSTGGPGFVDEAQLDRYQGKAVVTRLLTALGHHVIKGGLDVEVMRYAHQRAHTGTVVLSQDLGGTVYVDLQRYGFLVGPDKPVILDVFEATSTSTTIGGFVQDSWNILDRVTLNAGVRYDAQILTGSDGKVGLSLPNQVSPRAGVIYDFTQAGRSKLFVNFARYYESVPLDIADRSFPGDFYLRSIRSGAPGHCDPGTPAGQKSDACVNDLIPIGSPADPNQVWRARGGKVPVDPDIEPQSSDEIVVGGEYEVIADGRVGVQYTKRYMNSIIEDMSRDDAMTVFIGNPGRRFAKDFPEATRDYDAVTLYFNKSFSNQWLAQASYTLSYLRGNYAGLFRAEDGQLDPNINSTFDLISLLPNSEGPLNGDRTHQIKVFGAKDFSVTRWMNILVGLTFRTRSGEPTSYLGAHPIYSDDQAFILARGSGARLPWVHNFDSHLGVAIKLSKESELSLGVDVFNILNFQAATSIDERYTRASVFPIIDENGASGTAADLPVRNPDRSYVCNPPQCKLKNVDGSTFDGKDVNPNFGNPDQYQAPRTFRFSAKVSF